MGLFADLVDRGVVPVQWAAQPAAQRSEIHIFSLQLWVMIRKIGEIMWVLPKKGFGVLKRIKPLDKPGEKKQDSHKPFLHTKPNEQPTPKQQPNRITPKPIPPYQPPTPNRRQPIRQSSQQPQPNPKYPQRRTPNPREPQPQSPLPPSASQLQQLAKSKQLLLTELQHLNRKISKRQPATSHPDPFIHQYLSFCQAFNSLKLQLKKQVVNQMRFADTMVKYELNRNVMGYVERIQNPTKQDFALINQFIRTQAEVYFLKLYGIKQDGPLLASLREFLRGLRYLIIFLDENDYNTMFNLTKLYGQSIYHLYGMDFLSEELNALNVLSQKISQCKNLENVPLNKITVFLFLFSRLASQQVNSRGKCLQHLLRIVVNSHRDGKWYKNPDVAKSVVRSLSKFTLLWPQLKSDIYESLHYFQSQFSEKSSRQAFSSAFRSACYSRLIDCEYIRTHLKPSLDFINKHPEEFEELILDFMRLGLWEVPFWSYHLKKCGQLEYPPTEKEMIKWPLVMQSMELFRDKEMTKEVYTELRSIVQASPRLMQMANAGSDEVRKCYEKTFDHYVRNQRNYFQINMAMIMLSAGTPCNFQAHIGPFRVDLLINNRIIVQTNGPDHLITEIHPDNSITHKYCLNTEFKKKYLAAMSAYELHWIDIQAVSESTARTLKRILKV